MSQPPAAPEREPGRRLFTALVVILLLSVGLVGYIAWSGLNPFRSPPTEVAELGQRVLVNYIGRFEDGRIFDTSLYSVAADDARYPKSVGFALRAESEYEPFNLTAGGTEAVPGFSQAVVGLEVGEEVTVSVPPELGYGYPSPEQIRTIPLREVLPLQYQTTIEAFLNRFGFYPQVGLVVRDNLRSWDLQVLALDEAMVTLLNKPVLGGTMTPYGNPAASPPRGWVATVESIDSSANNGTGEVVIRHLLDAADSYQILATDENGQERIVGVVDEAEGTFQFIAGDRKELQGRTLVFTITLVRVF